MRLVLPLAFTFLSWIIFLKPMVAMAQTTAFEKHLTQMTSLYNEVLYPNEKILQIKINLEELGDPHAFNNSAGGGIVITKTFLDNKNLTEDGRVMTMCHEVGHSYGGAPKRFKSPLERATTKDGLAQSWSSAEGQADYYAASKCAKLIFAMDELPLQPQAAVTPPEVRMLCDEAYHKELDRRVCYRVNLAGLNMLKSYNTKNELFDFSKKAEPLVEFGVVAVHPSKQCRLDTILAGSICTIAAEARPDDIDANKNYCQNQTAARPPCWYHPEDRKN